MRVCDPPTTLKIHDVEIHWEPDTSPDLSYYGEYTNTPSEHSIDRYPDGGDSREYRYFTPEMTGEQTGNMDSPAQDFARMEAYNRCEWCMMGVSASARVITPSGIIQTIRSGGLWGVESDTPDDEREDMAREELAELRDELGHFGFDAPDIIAAMADVKLLD